MIGLVMLVALGVVVLVLARGGGGAAMIGVRERLRTGDDLAAVLDRSVAAGLLTTEQADAVLVAERDRKESGRPPGQAQVPAALEALGYLGATLVMAGAVILVSGFWEDLQTWSRLLVLGATASGLTAAGLAIQDETQPVLWRLRGFVLLLAAGAVAGFSGLLAADLVELGDPPVAVFTGSIVAGYSLLLWRLGDRPAQHLSCFAGVVAAVAGAVMWLGGTGGAVGVVLWFVGAAWLAASLRQLLPPALVGTALGAATTVMAGSISADQWTHFGLLLGLATALALVVVGVRRELFVVTAIGLIGTLGYLPASVAAFFQGRIGVPAVMLVSGAALLSIALLLVRRRGDPSGGPLIRRRGPRPRRPA